ncbi:MAG: hypothetical protein RBG1_1C00001G0204 [candidate division Zixibacteria bacterium RBG-1]|nr:MAG: hypothetical protein RBG1_1C00001G0204 [candidate division Zixibacteria bacterium RBG-1]OGC85525.1 MAG: hypothetical protein A2V73_09275 [candidate division Zixibacteria bacterium RBG_19FT_COMBO_42_43]
MLRGFRLWSFLLIAIILIYLAFTNRYKVTISKTEEEVFKYDRWTGKTWHVIPEEKPRFDLSKYVIETPESKERAQLSAILDSLTKEYRYLIWQATEKAKLEEVVDLMKEITTEMKKQTPEELREKLEKMRLNLESSSITKSTDIDILLGKSRTFDQILQVQELNKIIQELKK